MAQSLLPLHNENCSVLLQEAEGFGESVAMSYNSIFQFLDRAEKLALVCERRHPICSQLRGVSQSLSIGLLTAAPSMAKHVNVIELCEDVRNNVVCGWLRWVAVEPMGG